MAIFAALASLLGAPILGEVPSSSVAQETETRTRLLGVAGVGRSLALGCVVVGIGLLGVHVVVVV
jgi:hypothetical protein